MAVYTRAHETGADLLERRLVGATAADDVGDFVLAKRCWRRFGATMELWRSAPAPMLLLPAAGRCGVISKLSEILQH